MDDGHASDTFVQEVRSALLHIYNPAELRKSPLLTRLGLEKRANPFSVLARILTDAVQALKPSENVPVDAKAWRLYHVLTCRFLERTQQKQVAVDLGFSIRQLRREEKAATQTLADYLWKRYDLANKSPAGFGANTPTEAKAGSASAAATANRAAIPGRSEELAWASASLPRETADVSEVIGTVLKNAAPLMDTTDVQTRCVIPEERPPITGQLTLLRQALLNLVTAAIRATDHGHVEITVDANPEVVTLHIRCIGDSAPAWQENPEIKERLRMARQLMEAFGGKLALLSAAESTRCLSATVKISATKQLPVLVIDDNADTQRLLQRYLAGTCYRFIGTREPKQALELAASEKPNIILLDVMLPGIDGWELLGRLREHPELQGVPIVICTILPQEQVSLALGAAGFLRKPFSRQALLAMLDQQRFRPPQES